MNAGAASLFVEPRQAAAWLRANGWELVDTRPEHTATWRKPSPGEGDFIVELPLDTGFRDYSRRMGEVIDTLVVSSGKAPSWILDEIRASTFDIIRLRSTGPQVGMGRIPVELGARLFAHTRDLLLAAACSAHEPRPTYRNRKPTEATDFLRRVKLAAPEEGSFIVTVHAPIPPVLYSLPANSSDEVPFERRATLMLASAVMAARKAAELAGQGGDSGPFLHAAAAGTSANLCDALAGFVDGDETTGLDMHFAWAPSRLVPSGTPSAVHVGPDFSPLLREGARLLRASTPSPDFELEGAVVSLESGQAEKGGVATIAGHVDGQPRKVRVLMDATDYSLAIRAHEAGQLLRCEGELSRQGRRLVLERMRHLSLVIDEDE